MDSSPIQQFLADPEGFFSNPQHYVYTYGLVLFVVFTMARFIRLHQSLAIPAALALLFLLALVRNGIVALTWPTIFFGLLLMIGVVLGAHYLQRMNRPF
jgi:hypothetical protein